jgi:putative membrane protein
VEATRPSVRYQLGLITVATVGLALSLIRPLYPHDQLLQHAPSLFVVPFLFVGAMRGWFSDRSMTCMVLFLALHILGARFVYSKVPYDEWSRMLFGSSASELCGWSRNHYDRLVHLAFGVLLVAPLAEVGERYGRLPWRWSVAFAVTAIVSLGSLYEVVEWGLSMSVPPHRADTYNGQQGDAWDAQKDMALALGGAVASGVWLILHRVATRRRASS